MHYFAPARPTSEMPRDSFHVDESLLAQGCRVYAPASQEMQAAEAAGNEGVNESVNESVSTSQYSLKGLFKALLTI
jgi:Arc/MetJ family transcription regulator